MCLCLCVGALTTSMQVPKEVRIGYRNHWNELRAAVEPSSVGAGNHTPVLGKSSMCSLVPSHLSSPQMISVPYTGILVMSHDVFTTPQRRCSCP